MSEVAAEIAFLDPTDFEAGASEVIPGSHKQALRTAAGT